MNTLLPDWLMNSKKTFVFLTDYYGQILEVNKLMYKYEPDIPSDIHSLYCLDKNPEIKIILNEFLKGKNLKTQYTSIVQNNKYFEFEISKYSDGILIWICDSLSNNEHLLNIVDSQFLVFIEYTGDSIFITDYKGKYVYANSSACKLVGYTKTEFLELRIEDILDLKDLKENPIDYDALKEGQTVLSDRKFVRKNGQIIYVELQSKQLENGNILSIVRDITKRKKLEIELQFAYSQLQTAQKIAKLGYIEWNWKGNKTFWNDQAYEVFGVTKEHGIIAEEEFRSMIYPEDKEYVSKMRYEIVDKRIPMHVEFRFRWKNGSLRTILCYMEPRYDSNGDFVKLQGTVQDVTDIRKLQKENLKLSSLLSAAEKIADLGSWELYKETQTGIWSDQMYKLFNYTEKTVPLFQDFLNLIHPQDRKYIQEQAFLAFSEKSHLKGQIRTNPAHGDIKYLKYHCVSVLNEKGEIYKLVGTFYNNTSQVLIENELQNQKENLQITLNSIGDAVIATDNKGRITKINPVAQKLTEFTDTSAIGLPLEKVFNIINSETKNVVPNPVQIVLKTGEIVGLANHTKLISKSGKEYHIADSGAPIRNNKGQIKGVVLVFRDITKEYEFQEKLISSEKILNSAELIAKLGTWKIDLRTNERYWSKGMYELLSVFNIKEIPNPEIYKSIFHEEDIDMFYANIDYVLKKKETKSMLLRSNTKIYELRYFFINISIELNDDGEPLFIYGTTQDITESKINEEKLKELLQVTYQQKERLKQFSFMVSHNIRSSVSSIIGLSSLLQNEYEPKAIKMLESSASRLDEIIKSVNQILHVEEKKDDHITKSCNILDFVTQIINLNQTTIKLRQAVVNINIDPNFEVNIIPSYLDSILHNLFSNALKYGVTEKSKIIEIYSYKSNNTIELYIKDYGIGIDLEKDRDKLFKFGKRLNNIGEGQGIGLYMTKRQIEASGGELEVFSKLNEGTMFKLIFNEN
ncbi:MAG: PAS domain S-box protein [Cytophagales bacterium]